jgi:hypothetical protein
MTNFSSALRHVKEHLSELVPPEQVERICRENGHRWRNRVLNPVSTIYLFVLQLLANVAMRALRHVAQCDISAQAICKAKMRLPLKVLIALVRRSVPATDPPLWKGLQVYIADGTSFKTADKADLARRYGKARNQRGPSEGYPTPKLLTLLHLAGGYIYQAICLPAARQEYTCLSRLFKSIPAGVGLLLGDRGLVSFAHLALMMKAGIHGCFRLPRGRVVYGRGTSCRWPIKQLGKQDMLVRWKASRRPTWMSKERWDKLAKELTLRQIAFRVCRRGFRPTWAWIVTTLLDPRRYPAEDLIKLYSQRWQIEVDFRDLKRTLGMWMMRAQTVAGVQKEVLVFVLLYNLVRQVMEQAALQQGVSANRISFVDAADWLLWSSPGQEIPRLTVNPIRLRRSPARKLKEARHRFGQLHGTRAETSKPVFYVKL